MKIESAAEDDFLKETFMAFSPSTLYWIGLNDMKTEAVFEWSDGSALSTYSNWIPEQPDNWEGKEDCTAIKWVKETGHARWNDVGCSTKYKFICETVNNAN